MWGHNTILVLGSKMAHQSGPVVLGQTVLQIWALLLRKLYLKQLQWVRLKTLIDLKDIKNRVIVVVQGGVQFSGKAMWGIRESPPYASSLLLGPSYPCTTLFCWVGKRTSLFVRVVLFVWLEQCAVQYIQ